MSFTFSQFQATGNKAIDECANLIACAREQNMSVKALHLKPSYYSWFKSGVEILSGKALEIGQQMQFDGVDIEKGTIFQSKDCVIEYYQGKAVSE
jgi:hypothetical protein